MIQNTFIIVAVLAMTVLVGFSTYASAATCMGGAPPWMC